jgi:hypothetical protein
MAWGAWKRLKWQPGGAELPAYPAEFAESRDTGAA